MKLSLLNLGVELTQEMTAAQNIIVAAFKRSLGSPEEVKSFQNYDTEAKFMDALGEALDYSDVVVLTVDPDLFPAFKKYLAAAFNLKMRVSKPLNKLLQQTFPDMLPDVMTELATLPSDADALLSEDAISSGFAVKSNKQIMVVLPLDDTRMNFLMQDSVLPYLRDHMNISVFLENQQEEQKKVSPIFKKKEEPEELAEETPVISPLTSGLPINEGFVTNVVNKLKIAGKTVAIANTKTVDFLKNVAAVVDMQDVVLLSPHTLEKGALSAEDYAIQLAKTTFDKTESNLGVVLSKVYAKSNDEGKKNYHVYVCISDGKTANEAKVPAFEGDTPLQLVYRSIEVLFQMIEAWLDEGKTEPNPTETLGNGPVILS